MEQYEFEARVEEIKRRAHGHWTSILLSLGVDEKILNKHNQPCPLCGGTDRFQYTDKFGEGNYHCRNSDCGPGGGLKLLQAVHGWSFGVMMRKLEEHLGTAVTPLRAVPNCPDAEHMKKLTKSIWNEARPVSSGDCVDAYLCSRGLALHDFPKVLRFHPRLGYYEKDGGKSKKKAEYPAMVACIQGKDGKVVTLHRTYLQHGKKLAHGDAKKVLSSGINGAAVRLFNATDELAITEGIETALAVHLRTGKPVWAAISAGNMEKLWVPDTVRRICIYADNDANSQYDGQASAYLLARRLTKEASANSREVSVFVPRQNGADWADVLCARMETMRQAA